MVRLRRASAGDGTRPLLAGIEAGGTKFVCAVGTGPDDVRAEERFPTTTPDETLGRVRDFLAASELQFGPIAAIGAACFGPVDPDPASPGWGRITTTPKPGWAGTDVVGALRDGRDVPAGFDTDVNGAALGEHLWGAARGIDTFVYLTVGTGIGGGGMAGGRRLHGLVHPEMGHLLVRRNPAIDPFPGVCPFHDDCLEGLASGPALERRFGLPAPRLAERDDVLTLEAGYLAQAVMSITLLLSPRRIILGGGVMELPGLIDLVRERSVALLGGYVRHAQITGGMTDYLVRPALGGRSGVLGALALGLEAIDSARQDER
jgi:fructokinase